MLNSYKACGPGDDSGLGTFIHYEQTSSNTCIWYWYVKSSGVVVSIIYNGTYFIVSVDAHDSPPISGLVLACCPNGVLTGAVSYTNPSCPAVGDVISVTFGGGGGC